MTRLLPALVPLVAIVVSVPAHAGAEEAQAEHTRLTEEMRKLAKRSAWRGVDAAYGKMEALVDDGVTLSYENHYMGAEAARALGDINNTYVRLKKARIQDKTDEVNTWIADIEANYGVVELLVDEKYSGNRSLSIAMLPFQPDQRAAIQRAQAEVEANFKYIGLLPKGSYKIGEDEFEVVPGGDRVIRQLGEPMASGRTKPVRPPTEPGSRHSGVRLDLGGGFLSSSGGTIDATTPQGGAVQSVALDGMSGAGLRAGVGFELGLTDSAGVLIELGYHGLLGASAPEGGLGVTQDPSMSFFTGWLAGSYWVGPIGIAAGPTWSTSLGRVKSNLTLEDGSTMAAASGSVMAPGVGLGVFYGIVDIPALGQANQLGVSLQGGMQLDGIQNIPWGQVAVGFAPGERRRMTVLLPLLLLGLAQAADAREGLHDGVRLGIGPGWASVPATADGGEAFSGVGPRIDAGWELGLSPSLGLSFQLGWQQLSLVLDGVQSAPAGSQRLSTLGAFVAPTLWLGPLSLSLGPTFTMGTARALSSSEACDGCLTPLQGRFQAVGAQLSAFIGLFDLTLPGIKPARGGFSGCISAMSDATRSVPQAHLAFTIAPGRSDG